MKDATNRPEPDRIEGAAHPRHTTHLVGQNAAEAAFLKAHAAKRLHHAWLLTGPRGVGKATLAWRVARFLLTSTPGDGDDNPAQTLDIQSDHPVAIRIAALSEPRLFLLRRGWDEKTERLKTVITVDEVRRLKGFFSLTAADGGRRVVIVDAADEMNNSAANALLKVLEEPPDGAVFLARTARTGALDKPPREAVAGESELLRRLSPTPAAGRAWAGLQQELSSRTRLGAAVNLDPAALILDMAFKTDRTAAKWTAPQGGP